MLDPVAAMHGRTPAMVSHPPPYATGCALDVAGIAIVPTASVSSITIIRARDDIEPSSICGLRSDIAARRNTSRRAHRQQRRIVATGCCVLQIRAYADGRSDHGCVGYDLCR